MEEITLDTKTNISNVNHRRFFAIKNQRGEYLSYNYGYRFTEHINNAKVYCNKDNAIKQAQWILECKEKLVGVRYASVEKVYIQELEYKEVEE